MRASVKAVVIYGLADPRDGIVQYIGKSENPNHRLRCHLSAARHRPRGEMSQWLLDLDALGLSPRIISLETVPPGHNWAEAERRQIALHKERGLTLLNRTNGGEGVPDTSRTPEWKAKVVAAREANPEYWQRMKEHGDKIRGRKLSPEHRAKIGAAHKGKTLTPEHCAKVSASQRGRPAHPNSIAGTRRAKAGTHESDETKAKKRASMLQHRAAQSERQRKNWQDPEYRARVTASMLRKHTN